MKNNLIYLITLVLLMGCATNHIETKISNASNDALANESLIRYSNQRLDKLVAKNINFKAISECHKSNISQGLGILKTDLEKNKNNARYWNQVGTCYYLNDDYIKAKYFFQMALLQKNKANFEIAAAHNNIGVIYLKNRHYTLAMEAFKKALKFNRRLKTPRYNLAQLYLQFGHLSKATRIIETLASYSQSDVDILATLGASWLLRGEYKMAVNFYSKIPKKFHRREDIAVFFSLALFKAGKLKQALEIIERQRVTFIKKLKSAADLLEIKVNVKIEEIERRQNEASTVRKLASKPSKEREQGAGGK